LTGKIPKHVHWADKYAEKIVKERGPKKVYTCESGVTPSGFLHVGSLREALTQNLVKVAIEDIGHKSRHIYAWDSYDRFRKVPANMPASMEKYLGLPVSEVPDPDGCHKSMAHHFMGLFEGEMAQLGLEMDFFYMHEWYKKCKFAENIKTALNRRKKAAEILNKFRREPLPKEWYPLIIYCEKCGKDSTELLGYDGEYAIEYTCKCGHKDAIDFRKKGLVKLSWRLDWPNRWKHFGVDFEPAGKDHWAAGSSWETCTKLCEKIFDYEPPMGFPYEFISVKGMPGKMSSSKGNLLTISDLLEVYEPEMIKCFILRTKANKEIPIPMDDDLLSFYTNYDQLASIYAGKEKASSPKETAKLKRIYELSRIKKPLKPINLPFAYAGMVAQVAPDLNSALEALKRTGHIKKLDKETRDHVELRLKLAKTWVEKYGERYGIHVLEFVPKSLKLSADQKDILQKIGKSLSKKLTTEELQNEIYRQAKESPVGPKGAFQAAYSVLLGTERGPRLASLIDVIGRKKVAERFKSV